MGVTPSQIYGRGEAVWHNVNGQKIKLGNLVRKDSSWRICTPLVESDNVNDIFKIMEEKKENKLMGKKIKNIVLLIVAISVLLSGQIPISAKEVNSKRYTKDVSGTLYYVTDEYDCNGVRHITYTNNEKTICASYDGKIIQIVSDVEQHTLILEKTKTNEGNFVQTSYELQPQRANYCGSKIVSAFGYSGKVYSYATNTF